MLVDAKYEIIHAHHFLRADFNDCKDSRLCFQPEEVASN